MISEFRFVPVTEQTEDLELAIIDKFKSLKFVNSLHYTVYIIHYTVYSIHYTIYIIY